MGSAMMTQEQRMLDALQHVVRFDIDETGALLLSVKDSPDSPVELSIAYRVAVQVLGVNVAHEQLEYASFSPSELLDEGRRARRLQAPDTCTGYAHHAYAEVEVLAEPFQMLAALESSSSPSSTSATRSTSSARLAVTSSASASGTPPSTTSSPFSPWNT